jgi:hypothetical protein
MTPILPLGLSALATAGVLLVFRRERNRIRQREFIREYAWPPGLLDRLQARHEWYSRKNSALVAEGLRQYFLAYQMSGCRFVAMPSQVVDDLWHEFILYTRAYEDFCQKAFGRFFHHTPAEALSPERRRSNEGLRRVWWHACKQENIHPVRPTRLPLLFALDKKLNIANGFHYSADCSELRRAGVAASYCGGDFSDPDFGGSTAGMGDSGGGLGDSGHGGHAAGHGGDSGGAGASGDFGGGGGGDGGSCGGGSCGGGSCGGGGD